MYNQYQFVDLIIWSSIDQSSPKMPQHFPQARNREKGAGLRRRAGALKQCIRMYDMLTRKMIGVSHQPRPIEQRSYRSHLPFFLSTLRLHFSGQGNVHLVHLTHLVNLRIPCSTISWIRPAAAGFDVHCCLEESPERSSFPSLHLCIGSLEKNHTKFQASWVTIKR